MVNLHVKPPDPAVIAREIAENLESNWNSLVGFRKIWRTN